MKASIRKQRALAAFRKECCGMAEAAETAGVSVERLEVWLADPEFRAEVGRAIDDCSDRARGEIWRALLEKCRAGDAAAIRLYFDLKNRKKGETAERAVILDDIGEE